MGVNDLFAAEIATELLKQLFNITLKSATCRSSAKQLIDNIENLLPIIQEIKYSGNELSQNRQRQLDEFSETLSSGHDLAAKVLSSRRWNVYRNIQLAKKMEKLERNVSRFMNEILHAHVLADVHQMSVKMDARFDGLEGRLGAIKIGEGGPLGEAVKRVEEEERWWDESCVNLGGVALEIGKRKVKEMLMREEEEERTCVFGIHGIGGSGKTTLAREICKDGEITTHFSNRVFRVTVSQSPNVEQLRSKILGMLSGNFVVDHDLMFPPVKPQYQTRTYGRSLLVLDDVWSQSVLEQLVIHISGCKILVVSRLKFSPSVVKSSYELELLREDEALSLFCHFAFGQSSIPFGTDQQLIKLAVDECKGLPLALKVVGSSLRGKPEMLWTSAINRLSRGQFLGDSYDVQLLERMKLSIDNLSEKQRECFLDLGAFPEDKKIPVDILINMWVELHDIDETEAFAILVELSNKNLLTLEKDSRSGDKYSSYYEISVCQHDVLRDLAIYLNNAGAINPRQRKRLLMPKRETGLPKDWERNAEEPFNAQVISIHTGEMKDMDWFNMSCPKTEVLILNFSADNYFLPPCLANMPKLRALILINYGISSAILHNTSVFSNLTNLRSILFEKISIPILPPTTAPLKSLKKVSLVLCDIKNSVDSSVTNLPYLFPRLSEMVMDHCINLTLPPTITQMKELNSLSVTSCDSLQELPSGFGNLSSLQILRLYGCPDLKRLPLGLCELDRLKYLDISQCVRMEGLPDRIGGCTKLEKIDMRECSRVKSLPDSVMGLKSLRHVVCDEDVSYMWRDVQRMSVSGLCVHVPDTCFSLDWLAE